MLNFFRSQNPDLGKFTEILATRRKALFSAVQFIMHTFVVQNLLCPICQQDLRAATTGLSCKSDHSFDFARQGYVNLIDNKPSVRIR